MAQANRAQTLARVPLTGSLSQRPGWLGDFTSVDSELEYEALMAGLIEEWPGCEKDLRRLNSVFLTMLNETEAAVVERHGRQIMAMIRGDLFQDATGDVPVLDEIESYGR